MSCLFWIAHSSRVGVLSNAEENRKAKAIAIAIGFELGTKRMLDEVLNQIGRRNQFLLTSHARPDGDAGRISAWPALPDSA